MYQKLSIHSRYFHIKLSVISLLLALAHLPSHAQSPGYLGKRLLINYDLSIFPALSQPSTKSEPKQYRKLGFEGFNKQHTIGLEYVLTNMISVGPFFNFLSTKFENEHGFSDVRTPEGGIYDKVSSETEIITVNDYFMGTIKARTYGINACLFLSKLNPLGVYLKFALFRTDYNVSDMVYAAPQSSTDYYDDSYNSSTARVEFSEQTERNIFIDDKYHTYGHTAEIGRRKIYFNRIAFRYGFQLGFVFDSMLEGIDLHVGNVVYYNANKRLHYQQAMNFNMGIGYLLY